VAVAAYYGAAAAAAAAVDDDAVVVDDNVDGAGRPRRTRNRAEEKGRNDLVADSGGCEDDPDSGCDSDFDEEAGTAIEIVEDVEVDSPVTELEFGPGSGDLKKGRHEIQVRASGGLVSRRKIDGDLDYDPGFVVVVVVAADTL
jgi:hypothetical protein